MPEDQTFNFPPRRKSEKQSTLNIHIFNQISIELKYFWFLQNVHFMVKLYYDTNLTVFKLFITITEKEADIKILVASPLHM